MLAPTSIQINQGLEIALECILSIVFEGQQGRKEE